MFKLADDNGYIDIIIYVLIMVGGLVANAYRNYTKRKEMEKGTGPQPQSRPILPDILSMRGVSRADGEEYASRATTQLRDIGEFHREGIDHASSCFEPVVCGRHWLVSVRE